MSNDRTVHWWLNTHHSPLNNSAKHVKQVKETIGTSLCVGKWVHWQKERKRERTKCTLWEWTVSLTSPLQLVDLCYSHTYTFLCVSLCALSVILVNRIFQVTCSSLYYQWTTSIRETAGSHWRRLQRNQTRHLSSSLRVDWTVTERKITQLTQQCQWILNEFDRCFCGRSRLRLHWSQCHCSRTRKSSRTHFNECTYLRSRLTRQ